MTADRIKGITLEIGGDTTGLSKALSGVNSEIKNTQNQLKDVERLLKLDPSNTELLSQKQKLLSRAVGETKEKLEALKEAERQAGEQFKQGKISQDQYNALKREIIATEDQLKKLEEQAEKSNLTVQNISQAGQKVKEFGSTITSAGQELTKLSGGLAAIGAVGVAAWNKVDDAYDTIAKGTGATGEALEGLQESFENVFASIPTGAETAGSAIADINTRFGFTGEILEDCTKRFIQFAEVNNTDVSSAVANVSRYMGDAGIQSSEYGAVLDQLTSASQASGLSVDKLSESLTKYGAPMRALGFDTQESIAILAGWEKAGVNTEIAFSGMKKAIGTWGKEGKDAREEFKKTLKEIESCPDIAEATSKAIEVFGQKAGPDLADAIQGGRFAYEDFLDVLSTSEGQLERTFNDTLDPVDDVKTALQGVTLSAAELGGEILKVLSPIIVSLTEKLKAVSSWFSNLSDSQKRMIVTAGMLVASLGPMLIVIGSITQGAGALITVFSTLAPAIASLGAAGGPVLILVAAFGLLVTVFGNAKTEADRYRESAGKLTLEEEANKQKTDELYDSYSSLNEQRNMAAQTIDAQARLEQGLFGELKNIVDENGKVKKGYEERAGVITTQLADALSMEILLTGNQIANYKDLCIGIDEVIKKKQASALLQANESAYTEAITNQTSSYMAYNDAKKAVEETTWSMLKAQEEEALAAEAIRQLLQKNIETGEDVTYASSEWSARQQEAAGTAQGLSDKLAGLNGTLKQAEEAYVGYNTTISNYENLSAAIIVGDQKSIDEAILRTTNSFETAETGTRESLTRQVKEFTEKYAAMKEAVNAGAPGITEAQVAAMKALVDMSKLELDKLPANVSQTLLSAGKAATDKTADFETAGKGYGQGLAGGIRSESDNANKAGEELGKASLDGARTALNSNSPSKETESIGKDYVDGYGIGIDKNSSTAVTAAKNMTDSSTAVLKELPAQGKIWAADFMDGYISTMRSKIGALERACSEVAGTVSKYLHFSRPDVGPLREYEKWMPDFIDGLASGIDSNIWKLDAQAAKMAKIISPLKTDNMNSNLSGIEKTLNSYLPYLEKTPRQDMYLVLDDGTLVGRIAPKVNSAMGGIQLKNQRGG